MSDITYRTVYHGEGYREGGEPGPDTTDPRELAKTTLRGTRQMLVAVHPDGSEKRYKFVGPTAGRLLEIDPPG